MRAEAGEALAVIFIMMAVGQVEVEQCLGSGVE